MAKGLLYPTREFVGGRQFIGEFKEGLSRVLSHHPAELVDPSSGTVENAVGEESKGRGFWGDASMPLP